MGKHEVDTSKTMLVAVFFLFFFLTKTSNNVFGRQFVRESETIQIFFFYRLKCKI